jgi:hypothetical protein
MLACNNPSRRLKPRLEACGHNVRLRGLGTETIQQRADNGRVLAFYSVLRTLAPRITLDSICQVRARNVRDALHDTVHGIMGSMLLFHGTRVPALAGILEQGLQPPNRARIGTIGHGI